MSHDRQKGCVEQVILQAIRENREQETPVVQRLLQDNQIIKHNYRYNAMQVHSCALECCEQTFQITLIPNQVLYPKFCPRHRNAFQRKLSLQRAARHQSS